MKKIVYFVLFAVIVFGVFDMCYACGKVNNKIKMKGKSMNKLDIDTLRGDYLKATVKAIEIEQERYEDWIKVKKEEGNKEEEEQLSNGLNTIKQDFEKFSKLDSSKVELPELSDPASSMQYDNFKSARMEMTVWVSEKPSHGAILYVENMSRMGPWFHLAGIKGGDYSVLVPEQKYKAVFYTLYPRDYFRMPSAYVYLAEFEKI